MNRLPATADRLLAQSALFGAGKRPCKLRILITAGPTREYIDSVRYLSNASTGKMGYAIATAAARRGHDVILVSGPVDLRPPPRVTLVRVTSALEMLDAAHRAFRSADAAVFAAAVCDYRPRRRANRKMAKSQSGATLDLVTNPDIAATLGRLKNLPPADARNASAPSAARPKAQAQAKTQRDAPAQSASRRRVTIGFALEDHNGRKNAAAKLRAKHFDAIVLNSPRAIGAASSRVEILSADGGWISPRPASKSSHALQIVRLLESIIAQPGSKRA